MDGKETLSQNSRVWNGEKRSWLRVVLGCMYIGDLFSITQEVLGFVASPYVGLYFHLGPNG